MRSVSRCRFHGGSGLRRARYPGRSLAVVVAPEVVEAFAQKVVADQRAVDGQGRLPSRYRPLAGFAVRVSRWRPSSPGRLVARPARTSVRAEAFAMAGADRPATAAWFPSPRQESARRPSRRPAFRSGRPRADRPFLSRHSACTIFSPCKSQYARTKALRFEPPWPGRSRRRPPRRRRVRRGLAVRIEQMARLMVSGRTSASRPGRCAWVKLFAARGCRRPDPSVEAERSPTPQNRFRYPHHPSLCHSST